MAILSPSDRQLQKIGYSWEQVILFARHGNQLSKFHRRQELTKQNGLMLDVISLQVIKLNLVASGGFRQSINFYSVEFYSTEIEFVTRK